MDNETITNVTLHGATLYNATDLQKLQNMPLEEYLMAMMGPRRQENEVTFTSYARVGFDNYQNKIVKLLVLHACENFQVTFCVLLKF